MKVIKNHQTKPIDFSNIIKKKIYVEFNVLLYKKFNRSISDINYLFCHREDHLQKILEKSYSKYGTTGMREEIKYLIELLELIFNRIKNNKHFNYYEIFNFYNFKFYRPKSKRINIDNRQTYLNFDNYKKFNAHVYTF